MELKFKSTGSTAGFVTWLKGFKDIEASLLIEVDLETESFVAKSFPKSKCVVKYSKISFEDAGYELIHVLDNNGDVLDWSNTYDQTTDGRVKWGLFEILAKTIGVEDMFSATDHEMIINFDLCKDVYYMGSKTADIVYQTNQVILKSMSLMMSIKGSEISETFMKCDDNTFLNRVCNIGSPAEFEVTNDTLANLAKISSVFSNDKKDLIKFYSKDENGQHALYAYDKRDGHYDYLLGYFTSGEQTVSSSIVVVKENFMNGTKGLSEETFKIVLDTAGSSRLLVDTGNAKVVIAAATE